MKVSVEKKMAWHVYEMKMRLQKNSKKKITTTTHMHHIQRVSESEKEKTLEYTYAFNHEPFYIRISSNTGMPLK